eukprot:468426-Pelagomonas_calceolata.AAC.2
MHHCLFNTEDTAHGSRKELALWEGLDGEVHLDAHTAAAAAAAAGGGGAGESDCCYSASRNSAASSFDRVRMMPYGRRDEFISSYLYFLI